MMISGFLFALQAAASATQPQAFSDAEREDIGCVAFLGVMQGMATAKKYDDKLPILPPDLASEGRRWTAVVGKRLVASSGQSKEAIGEIIVAAALDERKRLDSNQESQLERQGRADICVFRMRTDLIKADALSKPLPKPQ